MVRKIKPFWRELYLYIFPPERFDAAASQVEQVLALACLNGGAVLDLCCGPGRHAIEFARRSFTVTGVDRTPFLVDSVRTMRM
jgi:ubiquinone/menaquinone biosynthesis C-methylase UbiE